MTAENGALVSLKNVTKIYDGKAVLDGVSLDIFRGEILCILGESGGGKTTLLNALAGLIAPDSGEILYAGDAGGAGDEGGAAPKVSYIFQEASLLPNLSALKNLTFAGGEKSACEALLARVGLSDKAGKRPSALSGGEKQRVAFARAFAAPFDLLLADEPFSALDIALRERMIDLFADLLRERGETDGTKTAVFVTHSVKEALSLADRVAVLRGGKLVKTFAVRGQDKEKLRAELIAALTEE